METTSGGCAFLRATKDVTMKADIVEEITRIYGYDNFDIYSTNSLLSPIRYSVKRDNEYRTKRFLSDKYDMNEVTVISGMRQAT